MSKYPGVKRLPSGKISYRGTTFDGFNKPRRSSQLKGRTSQRIANRPATAQHLLLLFNPVAHLAHSAKLVLP